MGEKMTRSGRFRALLVGAVSALGITHSVHAATLYSDNVVARNPLVYLKFDDTTGTVATDSSGNARNGIYDALDTLGQPSASAQLGTSFKTPALTEGANNNPVKINDAGAV